MYVYNMQVLFLIVSEANFLLRLSHKLLNWTPDQIDPYGSIFYFNWFTRLIFHWCRSH